MRLRLLPAVLLLLAAPFALAQDSRDVTREKLRALLDKAGKRSDINVKFKQSEKQPYNFFGTMSDGLANSDSLEIVVRVTDSDTIGFRIYPHYDDNYINLGRVKDRAGLMRKLLQYSDENFLYWGADESDDVFTGYTFTLESGFPEEAITIVLRSIRSADRFVGNLRKYVDGSKSATNEE